jgi:hypothetical protein
MVLLKHAAWSRRIWFILMYVLLLCTACTPGTAPAATPEPTIVTVETETPTSVPAAASNDCPLIVANALAAVDTACQGTGRNQVCYGNILLTADWQDDSTAIAFKQPGDIADLNTISRLQLSPMKAEAREWGVALMRLQASLADTLPGQNITFLMFGDVQLENTTPTETSVQSFYFRSGIGDAPCVEAPGSGILVQTSEGVSTVSVNINDVDITLGSTAYLQAQAGTDMAISVVEGMAEVSAQGVTRTVAAGNRSLVSLDENGLAASEPSPPQPYTGSSLLALPVYSLDRSIPIADVVLASTFISDKESWRLLDSETPVTHHVADSTSDGYICTPEIDGEVLFRSPESWSGTYDSLYKGTLSMTLRTISVTERDSNAPEIVLNGGGSTLHYRLESAPDTEWTTYNIALDETAGWSLNDTGEAPTRAQFTAVVSALDEIHILATPGDEGSCIDQIQLTRSLDPVRPAHGAAQARPTVAPVIRPGQFAAIGFEVSDEIGVEGEVRTYEFTAAAGQVVYFDAQDTTGWITWTVTDEAGNALFRERDLRGTDPGVHVLELGGTYTITVTGYADATGSYQFQLWDVPPVEEFTISIEQEVAENQPGTGAGSIQSLGAVDVYTFDADAGQIVYFDARGATGWITWTVTDASGSALFIERDLRGSDPGVHTLESGGTYTITVTGYADATGTYGFYIWDVPPVEEFTIDIEQEVTEAQPETGAGNIESPGAVDRYHFDVEAGQVVYFDARNATGWITWTVTDETGSALFIERDLRGSDPGVYTLESGGTYTITVSGYGDATGTYGFYLWDVPPVEEFAIKIDREITDGQPEAGAGNIESPGAVDVYTFDAEAGQVVYFDARNATGWITWTLEDESGGALFTERDLRGSDPGAVALEQGGTYTITASGYGDATGTYAFQLWYVAEPQTFAIRIGQEVSENQPGPGAGRIDGPGAEDFYTFSARAGQTVYFAAQGASDWIVWTVTDEAGNALFTERDLRGSDPGAITLDQGGTYTITVSGYGDATGTYAFQIRENE